MHYNRITIVGNSASGKSTLSEAFAKAVNLPIFHIDLLLWKPNWDFESEEEFDCAHADWLVRERWVIEGVGYYMLYSSGLRQQSRSYFLILR